GRRPHPPNAGAWVTASAMWKSDPMARSGRWKTHPMAGCSRSRRNSVASAGPGLCRAALIVTLALCAPAAAAPDVLRDQFRDPPPAARPRVWWHWMNGNVTKQGIRRDLDWMKQVGIGGVDAIDASINTPQVVDKRLVYMTPEWKQAFRYAARVADQRGIELSVDSSPGWSETGGPWVGPEAPMKKLVWSRTEVEGPFHGGLPSPPSVAGPFQNIARTGPAYYRDSRVVAYRMPVTEPRAQTANSNAGTIAIATLSDGDLANG